jgi:hypothetical protein
MGTPAAGAVMEAEKASGDRPKIDLGGFVWQTITSHGEMQIKPTAAAAPLAATEAPLDKLQNKTFAGTGYNTIWRPDNDKLMLNLTGETMAFSGALGDVPNRGKSPGQGLITLKGIPYVQRVGAFDNSATGLNNLNPPLGIHFEPGVFMFVPASTSPPQVATINRMASVPHGTTINAQGPVPAATDLKTRGATNLVPDFGVADMRPFPPSNPSGRLGASTFSALNINATNNNREPSDLGRFICAYKVAIYCINNGTN